MTQAQNVTMTEEKKEALSDKEKPPSLYKFNKRPRAMTGSVTPDHIPALGGYWDWDSTRITIQ
jgi:hypothetical protein